MKQLINIIRARRRTFIALGSALVAVVIVLAADSLYLSPKLETLQNQWSEKKRQLAAAGVRDVATVFREGKKDLVTFNDLIPKKREFPAVVAHIFEMAHGNDLKIGTIAYKPAVVKSGLMSYGFSLDLSGRYAGIKSFIADVQGMKEIVVIDSISLSGAAQGEEAVTLKLQATIYLKTEGP